MLVLGVSYPSAEMQLVYSAVHTDWIGPKHRREEIYLNNLQQLFLLPFLPNILYRNTKNNTAHEWTIRILYYII